MSTRDDRGPLRARSHAEWRALAAYCDDLLRDPRFQEILAYGAAIDARDHAVLDGRGTPPPRDELYRMLGARYGLTRGILLVEEVAREARRKADDARTDRQREHVPTAAH